MTERLRESRSPSGTSPEHRAPEAAEQAPGRSVTPEGGEVLTVSEAAAFLRIGENQLYDAAGVPRPSYPWHCLRHSYCTRLAETGAPPHVIQELAGHQSFATTLRYIEPNREAKRAAVLSAFGQNMGKSRATERAKPRKLE